ncbi:hypothetical protein [Mameliella sediminis]|uniref:hypothetical protein n=1 Tax=Mameliella sediminis TaxID=2836866 RepID=UPI001C456BAB|nr:hypothetical protein [Mameliella sediminis]MBV7396249.1 hypothetical protein [Mameliella sediminis]
MRRALPAFALFATGLVGSVAMANQSEAWQVCQPQAERYAATGGKYGYAVRYDQALDACMTRYRPARHAARLPGIGTLEPVPAVGCYAGAPTMYRGTLYCVD